MKVKFPLYAKIVCWFFLNLLFVGAFFFVLARGQLNFGLDSLIAGRAGERLQSVAQILTAELRERPRSDWSDVLREYGAAYHVQFYLFRGHEQVAGATVELPDAVLQRMPGHHGPDRPPPEHGTDGDRQLDERPSPEEAGLPPPDDNHPMPPPEGRKFMVHTSSPGRYWVLMPVPLPEPEHLGRPQPAFIIAASDSVSGGGLFFDLKSWVFVGLAMVLVSALFWFPLVRGITKSISRMTRATEKIAEGNFEVRTAAKRQDELGLLSEAIDRMAGRLAGLVGGQKRFLGDIAHELCSPIARIQVALGILEQRADEKQKAYVEDLREEVEQMSGLVNELLSFSKASLGGKAVKLQPVGLRAILEKAVARENGAGEAQIKLEAADDLQALAEPELLLRAASNILRNAIRYAGKAGTITVSAARESPNVVIHFDDAGPGIPPEAMPQIFDPFYRVDASRDRETGGVGLGLSIVKTCVESCGGTVSCENLEPHGLRVSIRLASAKDGL